MLHPNKKVVHSKINNELSVGDFDSLLGVLGILGVLILNVLKICDFGFSESVKR